MNPYVDPANERQLLTTPPLFRVRWEGQKQRHPERMAVLEVGCSHGHFGHRLMEKGAPWIYLGVDYKFKEVVVTDNLFRDSEHPYAVLKVMAQRLGEYIQPGELHGVIVQFPDPWPRRRSRKHRFCTGDFLAGVETWLQPGGFFFFKTDVPDYFYQVLEAIAGTRLGVWWQSRDYTGSTLYEFDLRTPFEQIFINKKEPVHCLVAIRE